MLHRQLHYLHESLEPDSPYIVSVWAETNGGEGPRTHRAVRSQRLKAPDPPRFTVYSIQPTSVLLRWEPFTNKSSTFSGTTFHVKYAKEALELGPNGSSAGMQRWWHRSAKVNLPNGEVQLLNLVPATDYVLVGVAEEAATNLSREGQVVVRWY